MPRSSIIGRWLVASWLEGLWRGHIDLLRYVVPELLQGLRFLWRLIGKIVPHAVIDQIIELPIVAVKANRFPVVLNNSAAIAEFEVEPVVLLTLIARKTALRSCLEAVRSFRRDTFGYLAPVTSTKVAMTSIKCPGSFPRTQA